MDYIYVINFTFLKFRHPGKRVNNTNSIVVLMQTRNISFMNSSLVITLSYTILYNKTVHYMTYLNHFSVDVM